MSDWVDNYIDNYGSDTGSRAFSSIKARQTDGQSRDNLRILLKDVIRACSIKEEELNSKNFKKLKIVFVNECGFINIAHFGNLNKIDKFEYVIFIPADFINLDDNLQKRKFAHEIAHFLFALQNKSFNSNEEIECNAKVEKWGFSSRECT